jgi:hypothetical protein
MVLMQCCGDWRQHTLYIRIHLPAIPANAPVRESSIWFRVQGFRQQGQHVEHHPWGPVQDFLQLLVLLARLQGVKCFLERKIQKKRCEIWYI